MSQRVMLAMSGGVDSSAAAILLKKQNYDICGATLKLFNQSRVSMENTCKTCCSLNDVEDARSVAMQLNFRHYVFNYQMLFQKSVISRFVSTYLEGATPNPCIDCNRFIKFEELLHKAYLFNYDYLATGHYARIEKDPITKRFLLKKAKDPLKDQSYVLYFLKQSQLKKLLFPLGNLTKTEVRSIAAQMNLRNADKAESQDICFVKDKKYTEFIEDYLDDTPPAGEFIDDNGHKLGKHKGIIHYTIGQKRGLGISLGKSVCVVKILPKTNQVVLGDEAQLYQTKLQAGNVNLIAVDKLTSPIKIRAKIRYRQAEQPALLYPPDHDIYTIEFMSPQRAITKGQAVVFYDGDIVIGGGTIL